MPLETWQSPDQGGEPPQVRSVLVDQTATCIRDRVIEVIDPSAAQSIQDGLGQVLSVVVATGQQEAELDEPLPVLGREPGHAGGLVVDFTDARHTTFTRERPDLLHVPVMRTPQSPANRGARSATAHQSVAGPIVQTASTMTVCPRIACRPSLLAHDSVATCPITTTLV